MGTGIPKWPVQDNNIHCNKQDWISLQKYHDLFYNLSRPVGQKGGWSRQQKPLMELMIIPRLWWYSIDGSVLKGADLFAL
jgi:hypothetical protein